MDKKINYIKDFYEYDSGKCDMDIPRKIVYRLIEFDFIYFNYSSFILSFMNNKNLNECEIRKGKPAHCIIVDLQNKGLIRKDIDIDLIEFRLFRNLVLLRDFIIRKLNMSTEELSQGETTYRKYEKPISVIVEQYCDMLANGLKTK